MATSIAQAMTHAGSGSQASLSLSFANVPTAGNMAVFGTAVGYTSQSNSASDSFGDSGGGTWAKALTSWVRSGVTYDIWWRQIGTGATGKQMTNTPSSNGNMDVWATEFATDSAGTWAIDGTPVQTNGVSANPNAGTITLGSSSVLFAIWAGSTIWPTAGTGWNAVVTGGSTDITVAEDASNKSTSLAVTITNATSEAWIMGGAAWKVSAAFNPGWATGATKMIGGAF